MIYNRTFRLLFLLLRPRICIFSHLKAAHTLFFVSRTLERIQWVQSGKGKMIMWAKYLIVQTFLLRISLSLKNSWNHVHFKLCCIYGFQARSTFPPECWTIIKQKNTVYLSWFSVSDNLLFYLRLQKRQWLFLFPVVSYICFDSFIIWLQHCDRWREPM